MLSCLRGSGGHGGSAVPSEILDRPVHVPSWLDQVNRSSPCMHVLNPDAAGVLLHHLWPSSCMHACMAHPGTAAAVDHFVYVMVRVARERQLGETPSLLACFVVECVGLRTHACHLPGWAPSLLQYCLRLISTTRNTTQVFPNTSINNGRRTAPHHHGSRTCMRPGLDVLSPDA